MLRIKVKFDDSGLRELKRRVAKLEGTRDVPVTEIFPPTFMRANTPYESLEDMLTAAGISPSEITGPEYLTDHEKWNQFVREKTPFSSWEEMSKQAALEYFKRKLGF